MMYVCVCVCVIYAYTCVGDCEIFYLFRSVPTRFDLEWCQNDFFFFYFLLKNFRNAPTHLGRNDTETKYFFFSFSVWWTFVEWPSLVMKALDFVVWVCAQGDCCKCIFSYIVCMIIAVWLPWSMSPSGIDFLVYATCINMLNALKGFDSSQYEHVNVHSIHDAKPY